MNPRRHRIPEPVADCFGNDIGASLPVMPGFREMALGSSTVPGKDLAHDVTEGAASHAAVRGVEASDGTCAHTRYAAARGAGLAVEAVDAVHPGHPADARRPGPSVRSAVGARPGPADP